MRTLRDFAPRLLVGLLLCASMTTGGLAGCSFIFDFTECEADGDCQSFDNPGEGEFFVCSSENKCALEPERQCRTDDHCDGSQTCQEGVCAE